MKSARRDHYARPRTAPDMHHDASYEVRVYALVEHIVPINRGANNINMLINILSINRGQPPEGGGFGGFVANMLINISGFVMRSMRVHTISTSLAPNRHSRS